MIMHKVIMIIGLIGLLTGCGSDLVRFRAGGQGPGGIKGDPGDPGDTGTKGDSGIGCTIAKFLGFAEIVCGASKAKIYDGTRGLQGAKGDPGATGDKGDPGAAGVSMKMHPLPTYGECVALGDGVYAENEGDHADIYNNADCDHGPEPFKAYCDNMTDGEHDSSEHGNEICWVGRRQFSIEGADEAIRMYELSF